MTRLIVFLALAVSACGPEAGPITEALSSSGRYRVELATSPSPAVRGVVSATLTVTDASGVNAAGLAVSVTPWMPEHGHGSSVAPTVSETSPGNYAVESLYLPMAGGWQLRTTIEGAAPDEADVALEVH